ncbi:MAG: hypothetical protein GY799_12225 [Desulfobulbaceae bacterium]|nr:hypothetical protein [Desulfobulbaceae bacterium]
MALLNNFARISQKYGMPEGVALDQVIRRTPILESAMFHPTNTGMTHKWAEIKDVVAMQATNRNDAYPTVGSDKKIDNLDCTLYTGTQEVHVDTAKEWGQRGAGAMAYFEDQNPVIIKQTLVDVETDLIYSEDRGFEVTAKAFSTLQAYTGSGSDFYSLYIVGWEQGNMMMMYPEGLYASNGVVTETEVNGGYRYKNASNKSVYGKDMEMALGFYPLNHNNLAGICNFKLADIDSDFYKALNDKLALVEGDSLKIYAHPLVINRLRQAEEAQPWVDNGIQSWVWGAAEMVGSRNFLQGTEALVTV